jgi:hypothetical protein
MTLQKSLYFQYIKACNGRGGKDRDLAWIMLEQDLADKKLYGEEVKTSLGPGEKIDHISF